jgi:m7GpppX diphosphatase
MDSSISLRRFKVSRELLNDPSAMKVVLLGSIGDDTAILLLEKQHFATATLVKDILQSPNLTMCKTMQNNEYSQCQLEVPSDANRIGMTLICPATEQHIAKFSQVWIFFLIVY